MLTSSGTEAPEPIAYNNQKPAITVYHQRLVADGWIRVGAWTRKL